MNITDTKLNEWMIALMGWTFGKMEVWKRGDEEVWQEPDYHHDGNLMLEVMEWLQDRAFIILPTPLWLTLGVPCQPALRKPYKKWTDLPRALCELCYEAHEKGWLE